MAPRTSTFAAVVLLGLACTGTATTYQQTGDSDDTSLLQQAAKVHQSRAAQAKAREAVSAQQTPEPTPTIPPAPPRQEDLHGTKGLAAAREAAVASVQQAEGYMVGLPAFPDPGRPSAATQRLSSIGAARRTKANFSIHRYPTDDEIAEFVFAHNVRRCQHGAPPVEWSDAVAEDAESYTGPLTTMKHSDSYGVPPPAGPAGENIYWTSATAQATASVEAWYSEVDNCKKGPEDFTDGCLNGNGVTGHFTCMIWTGVKEIGCAFSDDGHTALCRYKANDQLDNDTPNMNGGSGNYKTKVLPRIKSQEECQDEVSGGTYTPAPTPPPTPPPASCVTADGCKVTTSGCPGSMVNVQIPCKGWTMTLTMPSTYGPWNIGPYCSNDCGIPVVKS